MAPVIIVLVIVLIYFLWPSYSDLTTKKGAPFVATEPQVVNSMLKIAQVKKGENLYDLGSGDGRIVIAAASMGANAFGIEIDPIKVFYSKMMIKIFRLSKNAKIIRGDFYNVDLSDADVVSLFLLHETNQKLRSKLKKELKPGTRIISYAFVLEGWKPEIVLNNINSNYGKIYLYSR